LPIDWIGKTRTALFNHCREAGWRSCHVPRVGPALTNGTYAIYHDSIGIFLYQLIGGEWVRLQGLAYANMRSLLESATMTFTDGATFTIN
jgi:hypothetical protein